MNTVYIRPLTISDAQVSYQWRNNPRIWRFTGARPDKYITPEIETTWLTEVLKRENEKRFAICLPENDQYIGNVFLTDIEKNEAQIHVFIGEIAFWGKKRAYESICLVLDYGFNVQQLQTIYCQINSRNSSSLTLAKNVGFKPVSQYYDSGKEMMLERMVFTRQMFEEQVHLKNSDTDEKINL